MFYNYLFLFCISYLWVIYAQTFGHIWLFISFIMVSIVSIKLLIPQIWVFIIVIFFWWRLLSIPTIHNLISISVEIIFNVFGRNVLYFFN